MSRSRIDRSWIAREVTAPERIWLGPTLLRGSLSAAPVAELGTALARVVSRES